MRGGDGFFFDRERDEGVCAFTGWECEDVNFAVETRRGEERFFGMR